ncbi:MAG TPA: hypothetical protein PK119_00465 [Candidatus Paceibacterota bacterium]|nr:hypothetical protein [Candidatus Paceibacterota bacterium]
MPSKPISYFFAILLFAVLLLIESYLHPYFTSLFFINWLIIFIIFINFNFPFIFVFPLALISALFFDSLTFNYWGVNFGLFLLVIIFQKLLLKIFEKNSYLSWLIVGELLIIFYFLGLTLSYLILKQPIFYQNIFLSLVLNALIYWLILQIYNPKIYKKKLTL